MRFKLDECLDVRLASFFSDAEHDVRTVYQEKFSGETDEVIYSVCLEEEGVLITQDMDFSSPFRFSPFASQGIIVLRNPSQILSEAQYLIRMVILKIREENPQGHLWIVDRHGIRIWPRD
jgi:predicted nuclease of predicted toxin-antitoxin system